MQHTEGSQNNRVGSGRLLSWTKVNRSLSETAKSSNLQYKQCSRKNKIQEPLNGVYVYEVGRNGQKKRPTSIHWDVEIVRNMHMSMYLYIYIYLSLLANKRLATLLLDRWAGIRCTILNSFFFSSLERVSRKGKKHSGWKVRNERPENVQQITKWKNWQTWYTRGDRPQKMSTTRFRHTTMAGNNVPSFSSSSDDNGEYGGSGRGGN